MFGPDELRWSSEESSFQLIGDAEPELLLEGRSVDDVLESIEAHRNGGPLVDYQEELTLLTFVHKREHLERYFGHLPGHEQVVERAHQFLRARVRTPDQTLGPDEAVELTETWLAALGSYLKAGDTSAAWADEYLEQLVGTGVRWVAPVTHVPFLEYDGGVLRGVSRTRPDEGAELANADRLNYLQNYDNVLLPTFNAELLVEQGEYPDWLGVLEPLGETLDHTRSGIIDWIMEPVRGGQCDSSAYFELWRRGGSLWIGDEGLEVITHWAQRWPTYYDAD